MAVLLTVGACSFIRNLSISNRFDHFFFLRLFLVFHPFDRSSTGIQLKYPFAVEVQWEIKQPPSVRQLPLIFWE